jgi:hypothetical protein
MAEYYRDKGEDAFVVIDNFDDFFDVCYENNLYNYSSNLINRVCRVNNNYLQELHDSDGSSGYKTGSITAMFITQRNEMDACDGKIVYKDGEFQAVNSYSLLGIQAQSNSTIQEAVYIQRNYIDFLEGPQNLRFLHESGGIVQTYTKGQIIHDWIKSFVPFNHEEIFHIEIFANIINAGYAEQMLALDANKGYKANRVLDLYNDLKKIINSYDFTTADNNAYSKIVFDKYNVQNN